MTMLSLRFFVTFLLLLQASAFLPSLEKNEIEVIPNPHVTQQDMACITALQHLLQPYLLLTKSPIITHDDTFQDITFAKVLTYPVPIYHMKQPYRLSTNELDFSMVLVRDLATHVNVHETPVDPEKARDSWFVGTMWTPIVYKCASSVQHVGWKFTNVNGDDSNSFYALLVNVNKRKTDSMIQIGSLQAPGWMAAIAVTQ